MGVRRVPSRFASASFVTPNYFKELGTQSAYGRLFDPTRDDASNAVPTVVLSYGVWQRRFGSDPTVVGRVVHLNGKPVTAIGVTPFAMASLGGQRPDLWLPIAEQLYLIDHSAVLTDWNNSSVHMWGRLAPGVSAKATEEELRSLTDQLRHEHPEAVWKGEFIQISPGGHLQGMQPQMYRVAELVGVLTLLILVVSCANVGGLMLARAVTRQHEIWIRIAIGAGRWRLFRQFCTGSLLLGGIGSVAALGLSSAMLKLALDKMNVPKWLTVEPDWRVLLFTVA